MQMYEELNFLLEENSQLKLNLENSKKTREECEMNRNGVYNYCDGLKAKLKSFVETIDNYEYKIRVFKMDRDQVIKSGDAIIDMKSNKKHQ